MLLENHIENHHKPDSVPTVVGRDKKHVKENNDKEAKDDMSTRSAKPRKQEQDDSISLTVSAIGSSDAENDASKKMSRTSWG